MEKLLGPVLGIWRGREEVVGKSKSLPAQHVGTTASCGGTGAGLPRKQCARAALSSQPIEVQQTVKLLMCSQAIEARLPEAFENQAGFLKAYGA